MDTLEQKLEELKEAYSKTKYNKATNKYLGMLRAKMARVKKEMTEKKGRGGVGFAVKKSGDATVVLVGFPNAGKSSLLGAMTKVESKVANYAFTTLEVIPGILDYNGARIQILDVPGLIEGAHEGRGGGAKIGSVIRVSDLIMLVIDINQPVQVYKILDELEGLGVIVGREKPRIRFDPKDSGGIEIEPNRHRIPLRKDIIGIMNELKIYNGALVFYQDADITDVYEMMANEYTYINGIVVLNKIDTVAREYVEKVMKEIGRITPMKIICVSASEAKNIEAVKEEVFRELKLIRIYLKPKDGMPDMQAPLIVKHGSTVLDVAKKLHSKTAKDVRHALVSGISVKFSNQRVGIDHMLEDGDVLTIVYEKSA